MIRCTKEIHPLRLGNYLTQTPNFKFIRLEFRRTPWSTGDYLLDPIIIMMTIIIIIILIITTSIIISYYHHCTIVK